jgi:cyclopropane-fatty-acyl-phospholipid synthase
MQNPNFYADMAFGGSVGAAEAYMRGDWTASDLTALVRLLLNNRAVVDSMDSGMGRLAQPFLKALHWANRNTQAGARRNIAAHYDLGNDLFRLFLSADMMYSSAIYAHDAMSLEEASFNKLDRICRKLQLCPDDHVVEIGTGWGGFALHAAQHYGCRVTTTTISRQQHALAEERIRAAGLEDRITLLFEDYRDLEGQFDKLVSIEMIEAIGYRQYPSYFDKVGRLLKPEGMALIQAITIQDQQYEKALRSVDFIQRYIFPGCNIPSVTALTAAMTGASDLRLYHLEDIGPHYARTLRAWRERFFARLDSVRAQGYSEEFIRMWEFYLCYCEGGFAEQALGDAQLLLVKPDCRRPALLGTI